MATADHAVVVCVIAKCPIAGQSKTRLQPLLDANGSALLARAMLLDVVSSVADVVSNCRNEADLLLFYAPPTEEGRQIMTSILQQDNSLSKWTLLPVNYDSSPEIGRNPSDYTLASSVRSSNLSAVLTNAVQSSYRRSSVPTTVVLLGMDAPELPLEELRTILQQPTPTSSAVLCPAMDGGYVLLSLPPCTRSLVDRIFHPVHPYWSHHLTALAQIKALSDVGIASVLGPVVADIDTPDDLQALIRRLSSPKTQDKEGSGRGVAASSLHQSSALVLQMEEEENSANATMHLQPSCPYTRQALMELHLLST